MDASQLMFKPGLMKGQKILVTGGGTGLGRSMGRRFLELGASLAICGRREAVLAASAEEFDRDFPGRTRFLACDIRDAAAVERMVDAFWAQAPLDGLVNNAAGNFIEATADTPFLQIGEHKYGKPILDRGLTFDTSLSDGLKLALVSMDSTLRSNLTVGLPMDLLMLRRDGLRIAQWRRIADDDPYFTKVRQGWSAALRAAYLALPAPDWV